MEGGPCFANIDLAKTQQVICLCSSFPGHKHLVLAPCSSAQLFCSLPTSCQDRIFIPTIESLSAWGRECVEAQRPQAPYLSDTASEDQTLFPCVTPSLAVSQLTHTSFSATNKNKTPQRRGNDRKVTGNEVSHSHSSVRSSSVGLPSFEWRPVVSTLSPLDVLQ